MTKPFDIIKTLVLSTAHLPASEREQVTESESWFCTSVDEFGWTFDATRPTWMRADVLPTPSDTAKASVLKAPVLEKLRALAEQQGCTQLRLDVDGQVRDDLPTFDFEE